jgi:CubicO group peptidase (beta-lactamase class C family)
MQQHWQDRLTALAAQHRVVGASLAVSHCGVLTEAATGVLNVRTGQPATPQSVFQVGSITKVWTATLVMQLVDEGLLDLDDPVVAHLPTFRVADADATRSTTVRNLLCHDSGIAGDLFLDLGRGDDAIERYVAALATASQCHPRGATMSYCNAGYSVLGRLVEVLAGGTWSDVLRTRLLQPLGLERAGTLAEEALLWGAAVGHQSGAAGGPATVVPRWDLPRASSPGGMLHSTAADQVVFAAAHLAGGRTADGTALLSPESAALMRTPQVAVPDPCAVATHWGLGWFLHAWDGQEVIGHDGQTLGQTAFLRVLPGADLGVCLLTNGGGSAKALFEDLVGEVVASLAGVALPRSPEPPAEPVAVNPDRYVGRYDREGLAVEVGLAPDGHLQATLEGTGELAAVMPAQTLPLVPLQQDVLLGRMGEGSPWTSFAFFDVDGERYLHVGARAGRRTSATEARSA